MNAVTTISRSGTITVPATGASYEVSAQAGSVTFTLDTPGSHADIKAVIDARNSDAPELAITIVHTAPETKANTAIRTLARDAAHPTLNGLIRIEPHCPGCESYLRHDSLLIGEQARSWSRPALEILTDDVRCSHAATVKTITSNDLFYLRTRGVTEGDAETLLIDTFLHGTI